jgi:hypothetical protein
MAVWQTTAPSNLPNSTQQDLRVVGSHWLVLKGPNYAEEARNGMDGWSDRQNRGQAYKVSSNGRLERRGMTAVIAIALCPDKMTCACWHKKEVVAMVSFECYLYLLSAAEG